VSDVQSVGEEVNSRWLTKVLMRAETREENLRLSNGPG
jgi:hypothetical protein